MSANLSFTQDHQLDLGEILHELVSQSRITQDSAEHVLAIRRSAVNNQQHPLEFLAAQKLNDLAAPSRKLNLETLTQWLADA